jgi:hypothetical protein
LAFQALGAQIVGFNLPFDLSRLAIGHGSARGNMRGGFSLMLSKKRPRVAVKHISQRAALIQFRAPRPPKQQDQDPDPHDPHETEASPDPDRGYFVDVKTLAAALTSQSHSLASLSEMLRVKHQKRETEDHGDELTPEYIQYLLLDVQTTWECFEVLAKRFQGFGLTEAGLYDLFSEASLGKAYLSTMKIKPWRRVQPDFPPQLIADILSTYYGGRSEVHIRRQITPVIHCDFMSMYPTVCTLMGLWDFVRANGLSFHTDAAAALRLASMPPERLVEYLGRPQTWWELRVLVQVVPDRDLFPIRTRYPGSDTATIGLNYLSGTKPQWFTLADVLVSKILTGKTPNIVSAIRYEPNGVQSELAPITIEGRTIDPSASDFYRELVVHRNALKARHAAAAVADKAALRSAEQGVKILANATSYGIFVELNVEDYRVGRSMLRYAAGSTPLQYKSKRYEKPGKFFHPLLATLITGAARLMLALAEYQVIKRELNWAFCDTDSIAIANEFNNKNSNDFRALSLQICDWFKALNPYGQNKSILQLEKTNFPTKKDGDLSALNPPLCLAVSAKRYMLFNRKGRQVVVRKASGHGLGHLLAPYEEPTKQRRERIEEIGVPLWQEDVWKEIIRAAETSKPDETRFTEMPGFDTAAASQYAATTPALLRWFDGYNERQPLGGRIFPFGFLLSLQSKSRLEMAKDDPDALKHDLWRRREPRPAAPYFKKLSDAEGHVFDRERYIKVPWSWLKSLGRSLVRYHLHPEAKFHGGDYDEHGVLRRRHVFALAKRWIGKEAEGVGENEFVGEDTEASSSPFEGNDLGTLREFILSVQKQHDVSDRDLIRQARVSPHTMVAFRRLQPVADASLLKLSQAAEELRHEAATNAAEAQIWRERLQNLLEKHGSRNKLAAKIGVSGPHLGRVLRGERSVRRALIEKIVDLEDKASAIVAPTR